MSRNLVIYGSSRPHGETYKSVSALLEQGDFETVDLGALNISPYDYDHQNLDDDFLPVSLKMLAADNIVFATPVYWYAMSAQMKVFFDRLSDLITARKKDGRALAGKNTYLLSNGTSRELPEGFEVPFARTSDYFDMTYKGGHYLYTGADTDLKEATWSALPALSKKINSAHPLHEETSNSTEAQNA